MPKKEKPLWRRLLAIDRVLRKGGRVTCKTILDLPECEGYNRKTVLRGVEHLRDSGQYTLEGGHLTGHLTGGAGIATLVIPVFLVWPLLALAAGFARRSQPIE